VINGIFLVALGAIRTEVRLPSAAKATAYWTALYGTYMNWLSTILAAVFGTATHQPILAAGYSAQPWQETLVAAGLTTLSLSITATSVLVLWVFVRELRDERLPFGALAQISSRRNGARRA
jgi:(hydroxyamino)benzene mutase